LFEQTVACCEPGHAEHTRVTFGSGYLGSDPTECFRRKPVVVSGAAALSTKPGPVHSYAHLRLHNGTIWRWNRLLIGFDRDAVPHLRVEQRVMPAGPSVIDMMANAAFYYGAVRMLGQAGQIAPEAQLPFAVACDNFYRAARYGLEAQLHLARTAAVKTSLNCCLRELLAAGARRSGRTRSGRPPTSTRYVEVLSERLRSRQNGAAWQLAHYAKYQDFFRLTADYLDHQTPSHACA
jgi:hypothetical protein